MLPFLLAEPIDTPRLRLRAVEASDYDGLYAYLSDPTVTRFLPYDALSPDEVRAKTADYARRREIAADGDQLRLAIERRDTGAFIGELKVSVPSLFHSTGEIGWALHAGSQGSGYATEAALALIALSFGSLGLHRVEARLDSRNEASAALCQRLGMRHEGTLVQCINTSEGFASLEVFGLLREEWESASARAARDGSR